MRQDVAFSILDLSGSMVSLIFYKVGISLERNKEKKTTTYDAFCIYIQILQYRQTCFESPLD